MGAAVTIRGLAVVEVRVLVLVLMAVAEVKGSAVGFRPPSVFISLFSFTPFLFGESACVSRPVFSQDLGVDALLLLCAKSCSRFRPNPAF